ncbi:MAG: SLAC1 family transporter [Candidatus Dormibacteria bacterium]
MSEVRSNGGYARADAGPGTAFLRAADLQRFVFVMGAVVISLALEVNRADGLSWLFLVLGSAAYVELLVTEGGRLLRSPKSFLGSLGDVRKALGSLTFGVATLVLAARFATLGVAWLGAVLFCLGGAVAVICAYLLPAVLLLKPFQLDRLRRAGGLIFLWPVSLEATGAAASTVSISSHFESSPLAIVALATWGVGLLLYLLLLALLLGQFLSADFALRNLGPSYWVTMGAAALSSLGAALIAIDPQTKVGLGKALAEVAPAAGLLLWFLATALVPLVIALSLARTARRQLLVGAPKELWVAVFPAGVYSLASHTLGVATGTPWLQGVGWIALWFAVGVFLIELGRGVLMRLLPTN